MTKPSFSTFWYGTKISAMEQACLASFTARGYSVDLYSYTPIENLPEGVVQCDAREITDDSLVFKFIVNGKPSISTFSDYFRFSLFQKRDTFWLDADIVLLGKDFQWPSDKALFAKEDPGNVCAAFMHMPYKDPDVDVLVEKIRQISKQRSVKFGSTSRFLLMEYFGREKLLSQAADPDVFYPVFYDEFWKVFLPEYKDECASLCRNAYALHLWNNLVEKCGIWKDIGPPKGSYLEQAFSDAGVLHYFKELYPENAMRAMVDNYVARNGQHLGFVRLTSLVPASIRNTFRRRILNDHTNYLLKEQKPLSFLANKS